MNLMSSRIEPHQLGADRVDGHLVSRCEHHVLDVGHHAARPRPITGKSPVHHREDALVNPLLNHQQIDQRLVDDFVRPVTLLVQQSPEGVLHRPGHGGEHVRLHRGQVDDVLAGKALGNLEPLGINLIEHQQGR
jgi:hypothetical protein